MHRTTHGGAPPLTPVQKQYLMRATTCQWLLERPAKCLPGFRTRHEGWFRNLPITFTEQVSFRMSHPISKRRATFLTIRGSQTQVPLLGQDAPTCTLKPQSQAQPHLQSDLGQPETPGITCSSSCFLDTGQIDKQEVPRREP